MTNESERKSLVFWGADSQAKVLHQLVYERGWKVVALFADQIQAPSLNVAFVHGSEAIRNWVAANFSKIDNYAVAIGGGNGKARLEKMAFLSSLGLNPIGLRHSTATTLSERIGEGCQLLARSFLGVEATLGRGVILNSGASVDHECILGDGVHIGPGAILAGRVTVGARTFVGAGATICPDISIAKDCTVGAGAVVTKDLMEPGVYKGIPARRAS